MHWIPAGVYPREGGGGNDGVRFQGARSIAMLMMNALKQGERNLVSARSRRWAYLVSIGAPPFGLLFALKFYFGKEDDTRNVALICVILTAVALLGFWLFSKILLSGSGLGLDQIQQIQSQDIQELIE